MGTIKTPGVYIVEKNAFPNSVVEAPTAVPAFVGWTERAEHAGKSLHQKPFRITSLVEFHTCFGAAPISEHVRFTLARAASPTASAVSDAPLSVRDAVPLLLGAKQYTLKQVSGAYFLYHSMVLFFQNGGGACYIVSVGQYGDPIETAPLIAGIETLTQALEPALLVVPDAVLLSQQACYAVQKEMLLHCGQKMHNRFAILDVWEGYRSRSHAPDVIEAFREGIGINHLANGAAYFPWLNTNLVEQRELGLRNLVDTTSRAILMADIKSEMAASSMGDAKRVEVEAEMDRFGNALDVADTAQLEDTLKTVSMIYKSLIAEMTQRLNLLPPSAAMAGVLAMVDNTRGVWKAPANVGLNNVVTPAVAISHEEQEDLNASLQGKSINAIRTFIGQGTLVWGARTLDSNSLDWRYINVRRTVMMLEASIRLALNALVFEPNTANTWATAKAMISSFLTGVWKRGGLAGAMPEDAFSVHVGLDETMTSEEVGEGILRVIVLVAMTRPAEFIEITLQQQIQKG